MTAFTALGRGFFCCLIRTYQWVISPSLAGSCRFYPTCSSYAIEAITEHGVLRGLWLCTGRVLRCNPWGGAGFDPVPDRAGSKEQNNSGRCDHHHA